MQFLGRSAHWYRYRKWVPVPMVRGKVVPVPIKVVSVPIHRKGLVPVPIKVVPVPLLPAALIFVPLHCYVPHSYTDSIGTLIND